jgi:hypothetical protein
MIASRMKKPVQLIDGLDVLSMISVQKPEILITAGAGDIDKLIQPIKEQLISNS